MANNFSHNSKEEVIRVSKLTLNVCLKNFNKTFTVTDITIKKEGIDFEKFNIGCSVLEFDVTIFSLTPKEYKIVKDENCGLKVMAVGSISLNLP